MHADLPQGLQLRQVVFRGGKDLRSEDLKGERGHDMKNKKTKRFFQFLFKGNES